MATAESLRYKNLNLLLSLRIVTSGLKIVAALPSVEVYTAEVLEPIAVAMRTKTNKIIELDLREDNVENIGRVSQVRTFQTAAWLADVLK